MLDALIAATMAADEAERQLKLKDEILADAVAEHDRAVAAAPKGTFMDEWRAATKSYREDHHPSLRETWPPETVAMPVGAADDKGDFRPQPLAVLQAAVAALDQARHDLRQARTELTSARANVATALANYNHSAPTITAEQNTRDWIEANNRERARRAAERAYLPATVTQTARAMNGGGLGGDIRTRRGGGPASRCHLLDNDMLGKRR